MFQIKYTYYKTGNAVFGFIGTKEEWRSMIERKGGFFTIVEEKPIMCPKR